MRDRTTSLVSRQRLRANLIAKHEAVIEEIAMLGPIIRLTDYILCDALVQGHRLTRGGVSLARCRIRCERLTRGGVSLAQVVTKAVSALHASLRNPDKEMGMFRLVFSFTDTGHLFVPDEDALTKQMNTLLRALVNLVTAVPR
eukprot:29247-Pyramimonas_sp.AAC.1